MKDITFKERVKKYFSWLETDYNFKLSLESNSDIHPTTDGIVEYKSNTTVVVIDSETGQAAVWYYRISDGKRYDLDPVVMDEYLNSDNGEKKLLLSTDPKDHPAAMSLSNRKFLLSQPEWKLEKETVTEKLNLLLSNYAKWLKEHSNLCLMGDFSRWPEFYEYKTLRTRADYLRRGKDELGYARVKDNNGNWILI
ncbi:MAG: hypothetical protein QM730_25795 [Anaerolineales bacterium]